MGSKAPHWMNAIGDKWAISWLRQDSPGRRLTLVVGEIIPDRTVCRRTSGAFVCSVSSFFSSFSCFLSMGSDGLRMKAGSSSRSCQRSGLNKRLIEGRPDIRTRLHFFCSFCRLSSFVFVARLCTCPMATSYLSDGKDATVNEVIIERRQFQAPFHCC